MSVRALADHPDRQPKRLPILFWITIVIFASVPFARWFLFETDHQLANIATMALTFLGCLVGYISSWIYVARSAVTKTALLIVPIALGVSAFLLFEFVGFTGETIPVFRTKFRANANKLKETIDSISTAEASITPRDATYIPFQSMQFLGSDRNGIIRNNEFSTAWNNQLPSVLWKIPIGAGWSSFAVSNGLAITLEQIDEHECLTAFELTTGIVVWRHKTAGKHFQAFGGLGPRSTPTIHDGKVFAQTAIGVVSCVELQSGKLVWQQDLLKLAGIDQTTSEKDILFGRSGSPLIVDSQVVVPFGGKAGDRGLKSLISFDVKTGEELWTAGSHQIAYASPMLLTLCGVRQIVSLNEGTVTGHNLNNGKVMWTTPWPSNSNADACSSQPVAVGDNRLLLSKGYALGSKLIELEYTGDIQDNESDRGFWNIETVWANTRVLKTKFTSAIAFDGFLYGLNDGILECIDPKNGSRVWRGKRYGHGQTIIVNDHILVVAEDGRIALIPTSRTNNGNPVAEMPVLEGITWNVPAVAGPYLLVRNAEFAACLISRTDVPNDVGITSQ